MDEDQKIERIVCLTKDSDATVLNGVLREYAAPQPSILGTVICKLLEIKDPNRVEKLLDACNGIRVLQETLWDHKCDFDECTLDHLEDGAINETDIKPLQVAFVRNMVATQMQLNRAAQWFMAEDVSSMVAKPGELDPSTALFKTGEAMCDLLDPRVCYSEKYRGEHEFYPGTPDDDEDFHCYGIRDLGRLKVPFVGIEKIFLTLISAGADFRREFAAGNAKKSFCAQLEEARSMILSHQGEGGPNPIKEALAGRSAEPLEAAVPWMDQIYDSHNAGLGDFKDALKDCSYTSRGRLVTGVEQLGRHIRYAVDREIERTKLWRKAMPQLSVALASIDRMRMEVASRPSSSLLLE